ncbi:S8 family serine peptidase [Streptomyces sp. NPDC015140]|uniref:S8 family peptidase n=1 Tax=Streptomyces sp. NPDC015140 TaxID=3364943 RepID=UPI0036F66060
MEATLDRSTPQVRAPQAWAAGYDGKGTEVAVLDTDVDAEHPDLVNRVAATKNFTDAADTDDLVGHGTHTASTAGGSGTARDGRKKGVAPGTSLLIGKVLTDEGYGLDSWIIAGMQWAVDQKADVVSMSLGNPTLGDCTDPVSRATERLSRSEPTPFVVAAGNTGPKSETVSSPCCVPSVLTVGAVDRDDTTAPFSSRGPVAVTHTLKPELSAPGVDISAAGAGGRGVYAYRTMSGTSMATPHVAGAAAVVRQAHPNWTAADQGRPGRVRPHRRQGRRPDRRRSPRRVRRGEPRGALRTGRPGRQPQLAAGRLGPHHRERSGTLSPQAVDVDRGYRRHSLWEARGPAQCARGARGARTARSVTAQTGGRVGRRSRAEQTRCPISRKHTNPPAERTGQSPGGLPEASTAPRSSIRPVPTT